MIHSGSVRGSATEPKIRASPCLVPVLAALAAATPALLGWRGADWPAQIHRIEFFRAYGWSAVDPGWYGGHYPLAYSVLYPLVATLVGSTAVAVLSAVGASWAFAALVHQRFGPGAKAASFCFAAGCGVEVAIGQLPFLLGIAFGLTALLALRDKRMVLAIGAGIACALSSPLAGSFATLAALALAVTSTTSRRSAMVAAVATGAPVLVIVFVFPQGGRSTFSLVQLLAAVAVAAGAWFLTPRSAGAIRAGILLYVVAATLLFVVPTPVGANVTRLSVAVGIPVMIGGAALRSRRLLAVVCLPLLAWQWSPAIAVAASARDPSQQAAYFTPLLNEIAARGAMPLRIEIPFTRNHWETARMPSGILLARGWYRQLDRTENALFYADEPLTPSAYAAWLRSNGVSYVALPDVAIDWSSQEEARLISEGQPELRPVWHNAHWRLFAVSSSPGLVTGPARVNAFESDTVRLGFSSDGVAVVRLRYTPHWTIPATEGCLSQTADGWTKVHAWRAGVVTMTAGWLPTSEDLCPDGGTASPRPVDTSAIGAGRPAPLAAPPGTVR